MTGWLCRMSVGRRRRWLVVAAAILLVGAAAPLGTRFDAAQKNDPASFLPGGAESVRSLEQQRRFPSGAQTPAVTVVRRAGGLSPADARAIAAFRSGLNRDRVAGSLRSSPPLRSRDGTAALVVTPLAVSNDTTALTDAVDAIRGRAHALRHEGLQADVSGPAGYSADAIKVFAGINTTLFAAALTLVLILLVLIYRSPVFWLIPVLSVVAAEQVLRGAGYALTQLGVTVNGQTAGIALILVFGAGTDYALLLVARYREELRRHESPYESMRLALAGAAPAILASAATVILALLVVTLAEVNSTAGLGPLSALGVGLAMISSLTLLPALLLIGGRRAFWPFVPRAGDGGADATHGWWRRLGAGIARSPRRVWIVTLALLACAAAGLVTFSTNLTTTDSFRGTPESVRGQRLISDSFPAGANGPTVVIAPSARAAAVARAAARVSGVAAVSPRTEHGPPGTKISVTLAADPYSSAALDAIPPLRRAVSAAGGGAVTVGGPTAEEHDLRVASNRDTHLLVPLIMAVVFLILVVLLRALVLPALLIATVVVSYLAALGLSALLFDLAFGFPGSDPSFPLLAFLFLVALGVDYNIFLTARIREDAPARGTHEATLRGLAVTGGVITSAGVVLAGTFLVLGVLPLVALTEIGVVVALGVLVDTFIVRSILVPALLLDIGDRVWWPSRIADRAQRPGDALEQGGR
jgi:putative drug exporter of the RND superfamily